jgi:hypothetical protein
MDTSISPAMQEATKNILLHDPIASEIDLISNEIDTKKSELNHLTAKLNLLQSERPPVKIPWRSSVDWCLTVDADNYRYFLKSSAGVYKCVAFKHKVPISADIKNKVAITLSSLFKEGSIGRISINGIHYYGLLKFFKEDNLTELKDEFKDDLTRLMPII